MTGREFIEAAVAFLHGRPAVQEELVALRTVREQANFLADAMAAAGIRTSAARSSITVYMRHVLRLARREPQVVPVVGAF